MARPDCENLSRRIPALGPGQRNENANPPLDVLPLEIRHDDEQNVKILPHTVLLALALLATGECIAAERVTLPRGDGHDIAALAYRPAGTCKGVAVVSHGAGGSENGYGYLGDALAKAGWLAMVVRHEESGQSAARNRMLREGFKTGL